MRTGWVLLVAGFRRNVRYRGALIGGAVTNSAFGLLRASIVAAAIAAAGGSLGGYQRAGGVTYAWITQGLIAPVMLFGWNELALRVRTGDIAVDLARPVDLQWQYGAADLGRAAAVVLPRSLPTLLVGAFTVGLALPTTGWSYLAGFASVLLAVSISFAARFLLNLAAFWLLDIRGLMTLYVTISNLLCGLFVPVSWFPGWLADLAHATPFPAMLQAPADVLTGRVTAAAVLPLLAVQVCWLVGTVAAGRVVLALGTRTLVVQGG
jgi:ABC-2 type transport system permease protein